jgi:hypothetical protein
MKIKLGEFSYRCGNKDEEQGSEDGSDKLSDDVNDTTEEGDVTTNEGTESDGGVNMSTGDVSTNGDSNKESECMSDGSRDKTGGRGGTVIGKLVVSDTGTGTSEDEDEG